MANRKPAKPEKPVKREKPAKREKPVKLNPSFVKHVSKKGRYGDGRGGHGLSLLVKPTQDPDRWSKTWSQRLQIAGKEHSPGLGSFPIVSLAKARSVALDNAIRTAQGEDIRTPLLEIPITIPTVADAFKEVIKLRSKKWKSPKTKKTWELSLRYCKGIASIPVSAVKPSDIVDLIEPLWHEKGRAAQVVLSHITSVMDWAVRMEHRSSNPAVGATTDLGPKASVTGRPSLDHRLLGDALAKVKDSSGWWADRLCLIFLALTGVRSGEAREATWDEFDIDNKLWKIPAERMKKDVLHKVPLSTQVLEILAYVRERSDPSDPRVFPTKGKGKHITDKALSCLLKDLQIACVPHGLRKSLRTWAAEQENPPILEHAAEMLLAHKPKESIVAIYMTSTFYEHRIPVMQRWADYVAETMGAVVPTTPQASKPPKREKTENARVQISKAKPTSKAKPAGEAQHAPAPQKQITPDYSQDRNPMMQNWDRNPMMQNWDRLLAETLVPVTPEMAA